MPPPTPVGTTAPEHLLARFRSTGEPAALGALFDATAPVLFRVALSLSRDAASAEDALQETFLAALEQADRYDPALPVMPWLLGILRHKVGRERWRGGRTVDPLRIEPRLLPADPADEAERRELEGKVREALDSLPEPYRAVALMRWRYGLEPGEIAHIRGEPPGTVRSLLHRAVEKLRVGMGVLPAFLFGARVPRGLDAVRKELLRRVPVPVAAGGAGASAAAAAGGLLMAKKGTAAVAAALILLGTAGWWALSTGEPPVPATVSGGSTPRAHGRPAGPADPAPTDTTGGAVAPPVAGARLAVRVIDGAGRPVGLARVAVEPRPLRIEDNSWRQQFREPIPGGTPATAAAVSGADGAAVLAGIPPGAFRLRVTAAAFGIHEEELRIDRAGEEAARTVVLLSSSTLEGAVLGPDGAPLPGAVVLGGGCAATADGAGRYRLEGLPPGSHEISVRAGGALHRAIAFVRVPGPRNLDLRLEGGCVLEGRVVDDATGAPVPGASVFFHATIVSGMQRSASFGREVASGGDGEFLVEGIPPSLPYVLEVEAAGFLRDFLWTAAVFPPHYRFASGDRLRVEVRLRRGAVVDGRVLRRDGTPVAGAVVDLHPIPAAGAAPANIAAPAGVTGPEGRYGIRALAGAALIRVRAPGLVHTATPADPWAALRSGQVPESCRVEVPAGGGTLADVVLDAEDPPRPSTSCLAGRVRRADGAALSAPFVRAYSPDRVERIAAVGEDGAFRFEGLPAGDHSLEARAEGCPPARSAVEGLGEGEERTELDLVLEVGWTLAGRAVDGAGAPVPGATVRAMPARRRETDGPLDAVTDGEGRFTVGGLAREETFVEVEAPGFVESSREVPPGAEEQVFALENSLSLSGVAVEEETGKPVAGILVWANRSLFLGGVIRLRETLTDGAGRFRIDGLEDVKYDVCTGRISDPGPTGEFEPVKVAGVPAGSGEVRLLLRRGLPIAGRVLDGEDRPAAGGMVTLNGPGVFQRADIGLDGAFRFRGLPAGEYVLQVDPRGGLAPVRVPAVAAGTTDLVVRPGRSLVIRGRLLLEDGSPLPRGSSGFDLRGVNADGSGFSSGMGLWEEDGSFVTPPLDEGKVYDLVVPGRPGRRGGAAGGGGRGTTDLVTPGAMGGALEGRVVDGEGAPIPGIAVTGYARDLRSMWPWPEPGKTVLATTDGRGVFRLEGLAPGPYDLSAGGPPTDFLSARTAEPVAAGASEVVLALARGAVLSGTVVDAAGKPLREGTLRVDGWSASARLGDGGTFLIRGIRPGEHSLALHLGSRTVDLGKVAAPAEGLVLAVPGE